MPGVTTTSGSRPPTSTTSATWATTVGGGGGHDRAEVAGGLAVDEVAQPVGAVGPDQRDVAADRVLQDVRAAVDLAGLLALGQRRADAGGAEERADAGAGGAHPLGEVALRDHLELDPARAVEPVEDPGVGLARERADHLAHPALGQQRGQAGVAVAGVVGDHGQVGRRPAGSARRSASTGMPAMPKPPTSTVEPSSIPATASSAVVGADHRRHRRRSPARRRAPGRRRCRSRPRPTGRRTRAAGAARVPRIRPPEAPSGWPIAIAPPLVLTISGSMPQASTQASDCTANASLSSTAPTSAQPMPARASARSAASTGAIPEHCGSSARTRRGRRSGRAGRRRSGAAAASEPSSTAEAPSLSGEALPAVMVPSGRNDGFRPASFSGCESGPDALVAGQVGAVAPATTRSS